MRRTPIVVAVAAVLLLWIAYASGRTTHSAAAAATMTASDSSETHQVKDLGRRVENLHAELRALQQLRSERDRAPAVPLEARASTVAAADPAPDVRKMTPDEIRAHEHALSAKVAAAAEREFQNEAADTSWSVATQRQIAATIDGLGLQGTRVLETECRRWLCRTLIEPENVDAARAFAPAVAQRPPFDSMASTFFHYEDGRIVVFALRRGYDGPAFGGQPEPK